MASEVTALDNHLLMLKKRFAERTLGQLAELAPKLAKWQQVPCSFDELQALYQLLHRLAGSSGTFGFHQLGQEAAQLELLIKALPQSAEQARTSTQANAPPLAPALLTRLSELSRL